MGAVCSNGECSTSCGAGLEQCGSSCVNLLTNTANCGQCSTQCGAGQMCLNGKCECIQGRAACADGCVDLMQDPMNCGECGTLCDPGQACVGGTCQPEISGGGSGGKSGTSAGGAGGQATGGTDPMGSSGNAGASSGGSGGTNGGTNGAGGTDSGGAGTGGSGGSTGCNATGFHVKDEKLYDVNCNELILRGVNYPYAWYSSRNTQADFADIAATGANAVRIVLSTGARWTKTSGSELTNLIGWAKAAKLVTVVEVHDSTGYMEQSGSVELSNAVDYWTSPDIAAALKGQEAFVLLNIANEPHGNDTSELRWGPDHEAAIQQLRNAGFTHTLIVDGPNWGQDWEHTMRNGGGASIWEADPQKNLVFSVHMYDVYGQSNTVSSYFTTFLGNYSAPLIVGEFAADHGAGKEVDEDTIMQLAEQQGIGYLGWSWSGNGDGLQSLDITNNFNASSLTPWGDRLINGTNGIKSTSDLCTCFN